jgi:uncharacterized protein
MAEPEVKAVQGGVLVRVRAKPRASKSRVLGFREGLLEVAVAAPPVDGEANEELVRTVAKHFALPRRAVTVEAGDTSRMKRLRLEGISVEDVVKLAT